MIWCFACFCNAANAVNYSVTTLSYSINNSILKMFNPKLKFMHEHPFINQHSPCHQHHRLQLLVQDEHPHLPRQDPPLVLFSNGSHLERCLHLRNSHASCLFIPNLQLAISFLLELPSSTATATATEPAPSQPLPLVPNQPSVEGYWHWRLLTQFLTMED